MTFKPTMTKIDTFVLFFRMAEVECAGVRGVAGVGRVRRKGTPIPVLPPRVPSPMPPQQDPRWVSSKSFFKIEMLQQNPIVHWSRKPKSNSYKKTLKFKPYFGVGIYCDKEVNLVPSSLNSRSVFLHDILLIFSKLLKLVSSSLDADKVPVK